MELDGFTILATGLTTREGAAWSSDGRVYAGGEAGQIYAIDLDGSTEQVGDTGGFLFGLALDGAGAVYACDMGRGEIVRVAGGEATTYSSGTPEHPLRVPNFAAFDDAGVLYVTDSASGARTTASCSGRTRWRDQRVDRCDPGVPQRLLPDRGGRRVAGGGVAGPPRGTGPRRGERRGGPGHRGGRPDPIQPDGVALAADGTMFVGCYRPDRIYRIAPGGTPEIWAEDADGVS